VEESNSVPNSSTGEERSEEGNIMSGMSLHKRLPEYRCIFEQRVQTHFLKFNVKMVISSQNYSKEEVESIMAVDMRMTFVLSGGIWMKVLGSGGVRG
jgi:hypothetical protein